VEWPESKPTGWQTSLVAEERGGLTGAGGGGSTLAQTERRWWSRGPTEDDDKEGEEAPDVGAELGAVSGSSEGDRGGGSRWLNDGKHGWHSGGEGAEEEKRLLMRGVLLL
jgi:hypothetical protein